MASPSPISSEGGIIGRPNVLLETTAGPIVLELYWDHAPMTCENISELAKRGYYNNTIVHRVVRDFVIQLGDPTGTGRGGDAIDADHRKDEITSLLRHTGAGVLGMASHGPNTNGSQFYITLAPLPHLDGKHTIFGRVKSGLSVVKKIALTEVDSATRPKHQITVIRASAINAADATATDAAAG